MYFLKAVSSKIYIFIEYSLQKYRYDGKIAIITYLNVLSQFKQHGSSEIIFRQRKKGSKFLRQRIETYKKNNGFL